VGGEGPPGDDQLGPQRKRSQPAGRRPDNPRQKDEGGHGEQFEEKDSVVGRVGRTAGHHAEGEEDERYGAVGDIDSKTDEHEKEEFGRPIVGLPAFAVFRIVAVGGALSPADGDKFGPEEEAQDATDVDRHRSERSKLQIPKGFYKLWNTVVCD
jgi:hypothetical protein